jgi:hypothetical protein
VHGRRFAVVRSFVAIVCLALVGAPAAAGEPVPDVVPADSGRALEEFAPALERFARAQRKMESVRDAAAKPLDKDGLAAVTVRLYDAATDLEKARDNLRAVVVELRLAALTCALTGRHQRHAERFASRADAVQRLIGDREPKSAPLAKATEVVAAVCDAIDKRGSVDAAVLADAERAVVGTGRTAQALANEFQTEESFERLVLSMRKIHTQQAEIGRGILSIPRVPPLPLNEDPVIGAVEPVILRKGDKATLQHTIGWGQYPNDELVVKVTASDASLTVPATLKLDFEKHQFRFEYEIRAGEKTGEFTVTLTPAAGNSVVVKVTVK